MKRFHALGFFCATWIATSASAQEADDPQACFPECRSGYVCSPEGTCVSACNPPCGGNEHCQAETGECVAQSAQPNAATKTDATRSLLPEFAVVAQFATHEEDDGSVAQSAGGVSIAVAYFYPGIENLFIRPRAVILPIGGDELVEFSIDVGYQWTKPNPNGALGVRAAFVPSLWINPTPDDSVGLYLGAQASPFIQYKRFVFALPVDVGVQTIFDDVFPFITLGASGGVLF